MPSPVQPGAVLFELVDGAYVERTVIDVVWTDDDVRALLATDDGTIAVDALELEAIVHDVDDPGWLDSLYDPDGWLPHVTERVLEQLVDDYERDPFRSPPISERLATLEASIVDVELESLERFEAPSSPKRLVVERVSGRGSRTEVNDFLEGSRDGLVFHALGGVSSWKAAFVGRHPDSGEIVSAIVLHHYHPSTNGVEIAITRVANHEAAPANTSSYMISRARKWAERAGYERIATYAGVGGNEGVCYRAAGFAPVGDPETVHGKNWSGDRTEWVKQKYAYELEPEKYADFDEQLATASITTSPIAAT